MKILALESSAVAASAAVCENEALLAQSFQHSGLTHSRTLMPMVEAMLKNSGLTLGDMEVIAVASGPGSFTGLRIGISAAKGLAWTRDLPCAACSTLESMAWPLTLWKGEICAVMDARRHQVYHARFLSENGILRRLCEDQAISLDELAEEIKTSGKTQILVGDGAQLCYNDLVVRGLPVCMAPPHLRLQSAWGVARAAVELIRAGKLVSAAALKPEYCRMSQAEREHLSRNQPV